MGNVLESNDSKNRSSNDGSNQGDTDNTNIGTIDWGTVTVPPLPRIKSYKRRRINSLPIKSPMRIPSINEVNSRQRTWRRSDYFYPEMIPEPDYSDENDSEEENTSIMNTSADREKDKEIEEMTAKHDTRRKPMSPKNDISEVRNQNNRHFYKDETQTRKSDEGLVVPKKPPNPYIESEDRKKLCKELKFNQKYGNFNPKSELQIALDRYQEDKARKNMAARKNSLEKILEQQAKKIELQEQLKSSRRPAWIDRLQEQQDSWIPTDPRTEEFFQVHAKVMSMQSGSSSSSPSSLSHSDTSSSSSGSGTTKSKKEKKTKGK